MRKIPIGNKERVCFCWLIPLNQKPRLYDFPWKKYGKWKPQNPNNNSNRFSRNVGDEGNMTLTISWGKARLVWGGSNMFFIGFSRRTWFFFLFCLWGRGQLSPLNHPTLATHDPVSQNIISTLTSPPSSTAPRKDDFMQSAKTETRLV